MALYAAIFISTLTLSVILRSFERVPSSMKYPGPVRLSNCIGLVRMTEVLAAIGEKTDVLNHFPGSGIGDRDLSAVVVHLAESQDGAGHEGGVPGQLPAADDGVGRLRHVGQERGVLFRMAAHRCLPW